METQRHQSIEPVHSAQLDPAQMSAQAYHEYKRAEAIELWREVSSKNRLLNEIVNQEEPDVETYHIPVTEAQTAAQTDAKPVESLEPLPYSVQDIDYTAVKSLKHARRKL